MRPRQRSTKLDIEPRRPSSFDEYEGNQFQARCEDLELLEEACMLSLQHTYEQQSERKWVYDQPLKPVLINSGDLVLMFDSRYLLFPGKLHTHWMGPYRVINK